MNEIILKKISSIIKKINEKIHADKIILFGFFASGNENENSNLDLCIITGDHKRKIEIMREIRKTLMYDLDMPLDLLVYDQEEFDQKASSLRSIEKVIQEQGIIVYG